MDVAVLGDAMTDLIVPVHRVSRGSTHQRAIRSSCGGQANTAVWLSRLGVETSFVGKLGMDPNGHYFRQDLAKEGVEDLTFEDPEHPTGVCISLVEDGERTLIVDRGANDHLTRMEVAERLDTIASSKILYATGYSLLSRTTREAVLHAIKESRSDGCRIFFNPGAFNIINGHTRKVLKYVDTLIMNRAEASLLADRVDWEEVVKDISDLADTVVATDGGEGCVLIEGSEVTDIPVERTVRTIDTTGAGDAFTAGYMKGILQGLDGAGSCRQGHRCAAVVVASYGPR